MRIPHLVIWTLSLMLLAGCVETPVDITPTADLSVYVEDINGTSISDARVYIFDTEAAYNVYVGQNPDGSSSITPSLSPTNIGVTDGGGLTVFVNFPLDGTSFASGSTFIHRPRPLYLRVEGIGPLGTPATNDDDVKKITFPELESGDAITQDITIIIK
ncbi:MAG: hypothetical protein SF053_19320 [Bacteroidia bacterium]|nr:hypothetical protein [Bacteroidia bacterium]